MTRCDRRFAERFPLCPPFPLFKLSVLRKKLRMRTNARSRTPWFSPLTFLLSLLSEHTLKVGTRRDTKAALKSPQIPVITCGLMVHQLDVSKNYEDAKKFTKPGSFKLRQ